MKPIAEGSPVFADVESLRRAAVGDLHGAWQSALKGDLVQALTGVTGDFAVATALLDGRIVLAVDRFAMRTLCWRVIDGQLHCAQRADELAALAPESQIDEQALFEYLYFHVIPSPRTVFQGVHRLPPGHFAVFSGGRVESAPYWVPTFAPREAASIGALSAEFRSLLKQAVAAQLGTGKAACFLSGGTDSSTVAGMIGQAAGDAGTTYSIGFDAQGYDEMEYARIAARHFGTEHHEYYVTPADLVASMARVAQHYDQPFGNSSALPAYYCSKMARDDGVDKLLAGDGGDELFGGNARYAKQRVFGWYGAVPQSLRDGLIEPALSIEALSGVTLLRKAGSYVSQAKLPMPERLEMYNLLLRLDPAAVLEPGFLDRIDRHAPARQQQLVWDAARAGGWLDRTLAFDWRYTLAEADLPKVTGTTRLAGIGTGFPFLDQRLVEFSSLLPQHCKLKGLKLRWFFKEALRGFLPDEILRKKKQGFGLPFGVWVTSNSALHGMVTGALGSLSQRGIVKPGFIRTLIDVHLPAHPGYYGEMVWILSMLEFWLQKHAPSYRHVG